MGTHSPGLFKLGRPGRKEATPWDKPPNRTGRTRRQKKRDRQKLNKENKAPVEARGKEKQKEGYAINLAGDPKCISIQIGKQRYRALVDTGAEISIVSEKIVNRFFPRPNIAKTTAALYAVDGGKLKVAGQVTLEFKIGAKKFSHTFIIVRDLERPFLIGTDFMQKHGVRIYFDLKKVRVGDVYVPYE